MELIAWGTVALIGYLIIAKVRIYLEDKRLEKARIEALNKILHAELQIYQEKHGYYPTAQEMLRFHDEIRGL